MRPYTDIPALQHVVLEESYVLGITATPGSVVFDLDVMLAPENPGYVPASEGEFGTYKVGRLVFDGVGRLTWNRQGLAPATDASGQKDFGHIDSFLFYQSGYRLEGDWGIMEVEARHVALHLEAPDR